MKVVDSIQKLREEDNLHQDEWVGRSCVPEQVAQLSGQNPCQSIDCEKEKLRHTLARHKSTRVSVDHPGTKRPCRTSLL